MASTSSSTAPPCRPRRGETSHFALLSPCSPPLPSCSGAWGDLFTFQCQLVCCCLSWSSIGWPASSCYIAGTSPPCQLFPPCCSAWRSSAPSTTTPSHGCAGLRLGGFTSSSGKLSYSHNFVGGGPRRIYFFSSSNFSCLAVIVTSNPVPCSRVWESDKYTLTSYTWSCSLSFMKRAQSCLKLVHKIRKSLNWTWYHLWTSDKKETRTEGMSYKLFKDGQILPHKDTRSGRNYVRAT